MDNWISVYSTQKMYQAEIAKSTLEENGIEAVILNQEDSSFLIGEISVMIQAEDKEKAEEIIKGIKE